MRVVRHFQRWRNRAWRRAMWQAIQEAAENHRGSMRKNKVHPVNGLRVIRIFEDVNGIKYDPFNQRHRMKTYGHRGLIALWSVRKGLSKLGETL